MSLSSAVQAAVSGIGASARRAEIVATNIANAASAGYARRSLEIVANAVAPGTRIEDTHRHVDRLVLAEARFANAELGQRELLSEQTLRIERALGVAGDSDSITGVINRLESALIAAAGNPSSEARLAEVADATAALSQRFAHASRGLQSVRAEADRSIAADVESLNTGLSRIAELDRRILVTVASGRDASSLQDLKQREIDAIGQIVPLRESQRSDGRSVLTTLAGAILLDGRAATVEFEATRNISATGPDGEGITIDGKPALATDGGILAGGRLSAAFALRDRIVPQMHQDLDRLAADISQRLTAADPTLTPTSPGLLTDAGDLIDPARVTGLSARLQLNDAVDFDHGGALWRIRSGIGAAFAGPSGSSAVLDALRSSLASRPDAPSDQAASMTERVAHARVSAESDTTSARARAQTVEARLAEGGVNSDAELQTLMQIEKAYAANARVLQAVDEMLAYLLAR